MKRVLVPILTEEYKINVFLGGKEELIKQAAKYLGKDEEDVRDFFKSKRGCAINCIPDGLHPLILVSTELDVFTGFATLAHEASHAMDYIQSQLGITDSSGEVHAHGIASVMRHTLQDLHKLLSKDLKKKK